MREKQTDCPKRLDTLSGSELRVVGCHIWCSTMRFAIWVLSCHHLRMDGQASSIDAQGRASSASMYSGRSAASGNTVTPPDSGASAGPSDIPVRAAASTARDTMPAVPCEPSERERPQVASQAARDALNAPEGASDLSSTKGSGGPAGDAAKSPQTCRKSKPGTQNASSQQKPRWCRLCLVEKPIAEFRPQRRDGDRILSRATECNACHNTREMTRRDLRKRQKDRALLYEAWGYLARPETKRMCVERFLLDLMRHFGGASGLSKAWYEAFLEAAAARRVRACESLVRLTDWFTKYPDVLTGAAQLEDAQLEEELLKLKVEATFELFRKHPDVVALIAQRTGYRLVGCVDEPESGNSSLCSV